MCVFAWGGHRPSEEVPGRTVEEEGRGEWEEWDNGKNGSPPREKHMTACGKVGGRGGATKGTKKANKGSQLTNIVVTRKGRK
jgi:hypothetical protein